MGVPAAQAAEETGTKNLSTPVILVDQDTMSAGFNKITVPAEPDGNPDYVKDGLNYYTSVAGTGAQTYDADVWGANWAFEGAKPVVADVKWGDNLLSHVFPGNRKQPIRVEVNLFADATTAAAYGTMQGYAMVSLEGEMSGEIFGTLGKAEAMTPMVFTPKATLSILKYDSATKWYSTVILPPTTMAGEVNASGKVIYGFNWGKSAGLAAPSPGNYRLVFTVADDSLVTFGGVLGGEDAEDSGTVNVAYLGGPKVSYLDMPVGTTPLSPALPFDVAAETATDVGSDFNSDGHADVIARDTLGNLWLYPGSGVSSWLPRVKVGIGWNGMTAIVAPGDFSGDGHPDLLARDSLGNLWLYPGSGKSSWLAKVKVGIGWNGMTALVAPGDFNGDMHPDLLARDSQGNLWLYPGSGKSSWLAKVKVGIGWNGMTALVGVGDFNGDTHPDLLARDTLGNLWMYPGNGKGGWLTKAKVGNGWNGMTALVGPGDFSGDGHVDVLARNALGQLLLYRGSGVASWIRPVQQVGIGWNSMTMIVS